MKISHWIVAGILLSATPAWSNGPFDFEFEELAPGVWAGVRPDGPRAPVMGNVTFVVSNEGVVVYDGGGAPAMSEQVIAKIQSLTDVPVTHVITSHWHGDHNFGIYRFADEFEGVQFIAHEFTRDVMNSSRINYVDGQKGFVERNIERFQAIVDTGVDAEGQAYNETERATYQRLIDDGPAIDAEYARYKVTPPNVVIDGSLVIQSGNRRIEILHLGAANTEGDVVMWLPEEQIVATGDIVVLPSPYAFNVPPRAWAQTMKNLNALDYQILVPGHGAIQHDKAYVDLLIASAEDIAGQRDTMLADGMSAEDVEAGLDFSGFENEFTNGDAYRKIFFDAWFAGPFRAAAMKALNDEPMVEIPAAEEVAMTDERWSIEAAEHEITEYKGQQALRIRGGSAILPELDIRNGMIEFDMAVGEARGFSGIVFRQTEGANYENFYIRPHQSGNPDATQYQPVFNGSASWQLYHGEGYSTPIEYRHDEWMPVRLIFAGRKAEVYVDSDEPQLLIPELKHDNQSGAIGIAVGNFAPAYIANFRFTQLADAYELPIDRPTLAPIDGVINSWQVSDPFSSAQLEGRASIEGGILNDRAWESVTAEPTGIVNLAQYAELGESTNTVFARLNVQSAEDAVKLLSFGYSDRARVYVNGRLQYTGDNTYLTRDYRYLGTIGYFDTVAVSLSPGDNDVVIAVSESFGGWGLMARLSDIEEGN